MGNTCGNQEIKPTDTSTIEYEVEPIVTLLSCVPVSIIDKIPSFESFEGTCYNSEFIPIEDISNVSQPHSFFKIQNKVSAHFLLGKFHSFTPFYEEKKEINESLSFYNQFKFYSELRNQKKTASEVNIVEAKSLILDSYSTIFGLHTFNYAFLYEDIETSYKEIIEYRFSQKDLGTYSPKEIKFMFSKFVNWLKTIHSLGFALLNIFPENIFLISKDFKAFNMQFLRFEEETVKANKCPLRTQKYLPELQNENANFNPTKSDIFMMGLFFLSLLTKETNFASFEDSSYRIKQMKTIREMNNEYNTILEKMLEKDPDERADLDTILQEIEKIRVLDKGTSLTDFSFEKCQNSHWKEKVKLDNAIPQPTLESSFFRGIRRENHVELQVEFPEKISKLSFYLKMGNKEQASKFIPDIQSYMLDRPCEEIKEMRVIIYETVGSLHSHPHCQEEIKNFLKAFLEKSTKEMNSKPNEHNKLDFLFCKVFEALMILKTTGNHESCLKVLVEMKSFLDGMNVTTELEKLIVSCYFSGLNVCYANLQHPNLLESLDDWDRKIKDKTTVLSKSLINARRADFYISNGNQISHGRFLLKDSMNGCVLFLGESHVLTEIIRTEYGLTMINEGFISEGISFIYQANVGLFQYTNEQSKIRNSAKFYLAIAQLRNGQNKESLENLKDCLNYAEKINPLHPSAAAIAVDLSSILIELHEKSHVETLIDKFLAFAKSNCNERQFSSNLEKEALYLYLLNNKTLSNFFAGNKEEADDTLAVAFDFAGKIRGIQKSNNCIEKAFFSLLMTSAFISDFFGRKDTSLKTLGICEEVINKILTPEHPDMCNVIINTAKCLADQRNFTRAKDIMTGILNSRIFPETSISIGILKHNLAVISQEIENLDTAARCFDEARICFDSHFSMGNNPYNAILYSNLAAFELRNNQRVKAQEFLTSANEFFTQNDHYLAKTVIKNNAGIVNFKYGFIHQALELFFQALEQFTTYVGSFHTMVASIETNIAVCYVVNQELIKANKVFESAFQKKEKFHRVGDFVILPCLYNFLNSLNGNMELSQKIAQIVLTAKNQYQENEQELGDLNALFSEIFEKRQMFKEAKSFCEKSIEIYSANLPKCEAKLKKARETLNAFSR